MGRKRNSGGEQYRRIAGLAARQRWVVAGWQLREMGVTGAAIEHGVATSRLHPVFRGVFAVGHPQVGDRGRMLAAVLACGEGAVVSHGTAAALLGLWDRPPTLVDVIAPGQSGRKIEGIRRRHVLLPGPEEAEVRESVPCTRPARTLVDLAGAVGESRLRSTVERTAVLGLLEVPAVDAALSRRRRRGSRLLRMVLEDWRPVGAARLRSDLEARLLARIAAAGLPIPLCNQVVEVAGRHMEVDFLWPDRLLVVEADGRAFHDNPIAFDRDRRRTATSLEPASGCCGSHGLNWRGNPAKRWPPSISFLSIPHPDDRCGFWGRRAFPLRCSFSSL